MESFHTLIRSVQICFIFFCIALTPKISLSQSIHAESLSLFLQRDGFENVSVSYQNYNLVVSLENRVYRSDTEALFSVLSIIHNDNLFKDSITIQFERSGIPRIQISTSADDLKDLFEYPDYVSEWVERSRIELHPDSKTPPFAEDRSKSGRMTPERMVTGDAWFMQPHLIMGLTPQYQLGNYNNPLRLRLELTPELSVHLPYGVRFRGSIGIPLYNDLDRNRTVRLSHLSLTRQFQVQPGLYGGISTGFFSRNRVGAHVQLTQFLWGERFSLTYQGGYTRFSSAMGSVDDPFVEDQPYVVSTVAAEYRWKAYHLDLNIEYGQFLYYDSGFKVDVQRYFGETIIGMFALKTRLGTNYGFHVSIPLFPKKGTRVSGLMIRSASHIPFSYRYEGNDRTGRMYNTGIDYPTKLKRVYPSYLLDELEAYFEGQ